MASTDEQGTSYEAEHVHSVYEQIASHFSSTRYKVYITYPIISLRRRANRIHPAMADSRAVSQRAG